MNRRSFLKITAAGVAATAFVPAASAASRRNLRKAIMYSTIGVKGSVLEKFRVMKEAGFEGVEPMGAMNRDQVLAAFKETGLQAASVCDHIHWVKTLSAPDEAEVQTLREVRRRRANAPASWSAPVLWRFHVNGGGRETEWPQLIS